MATRPSASKTPAVKAAPPPAAAAAAPQARPERAAKPAARAAAKAVVKPLPAVAAAAAPQVAAKATAPVKSAKPAKPAKPVKAAKAVKAEKAAKPAKLHQKPVRDSFTMPEADFSLVATLKARALAGKRETKKSELLRAGLHALAAMDGATLLAALHALEPIKTGRPRKGH